MKISAFFSSAVLVLMLLSGQAQADLPDFRPLVKQASPAVVNISTVQRASSRQTNAQGYNLPPDMPEIFRRFFEVPEGGQEGADRTSLGSGFIISKDGYILTNNHVIQDADEIVVRLNDRRELEAKLIGADASTDLALLKVDAKNLPTVKLGNSEKLEVGEWVVAIGSPFGFDYSVTAGIVSAKGRSLPNENYVPFIQTDVAINPGNSGGPLFNLNGEVVGINSQIYTRSGGFMGVSFAIPINVALDVSEQLKTSGKVSRGWLGVVIQEVNKDLAESFGLDRAAGALVAQIMPDSPAAKSELKNGDIITHFDGRPIFLSSDLPHEVGMVKPGTSVALDVVRNGKRKKVVVTIGVMPDSDDNELATRGSKNTDTTVNRLGVVVGELSVAQRKNAGDGVVVRAVKQGPAAQAGINNGDVITHVSGQGIRTVAEFEEVVASLPVGRNVPIRVLRRGSALFIPLRIAP